jgi:hypothetical protein
MATILSYDPLPEGYGWNLANKIKRDTGYWPSITTTALHTYINFTQDLTPEQIAAVDSLMADAGAQDPVIGIPGNTYVIKDIWEWLSFIEQQTGIKFMLTYGSSGTFGPNVQDLIYMVPVEADGVTELELAPNQRNAVENIIKQNTGEWQ